MPGLRTVRPFVEDYVSQCLTASRRRGYSNGRDSVARYLAMQKTSHPLFRMRSSARSHTYLAQESRSVKSASPSALFIAALTWFLLIKMVRVHRARATIPHTRQPHLRSMAHLPFSAAGPRTAVRAGPISSKQNGPPGTVIKKPRPTLQSIASSRVPLHPAIAPLRSLCRITGTRLAPCMPRCSALAGVQQTPYSILCGHCTRLADHPSSAPRTPAHPTTLFDRRRQP
jgi:hypothetical protein